MTALVWDNSGTRLYETGISKGVLFPLNTGTGLYDTGFAWNGLTGIKEKPAGAAVTKSYADNINYLSLLSKETFDFEIDAYTYPTAFEACDGTMETAKVGVAVNQQSRQTFGMAYRTEIGNDVDSTLGYKLHLVYGCLAAPAEKDYSTINDSPAAVSFSWTVTTTPVAVTGFGPTSLIVVDSTKVSAGNLTIIENTLYGASATPELPLPDALLALLT